MSADPPNATPRSVGPYLVEREIGRGGMGVVWLARDPRLDRSVAIKTLPPDLAADPERLARFAREAKLLASLNHPNVAGIHGLEEADGTTCLVLEYVDGETLAERIARGAMPIDEALAVCAQIAAGLEAAHEAGVIHRDLKPGNVKIARDGTVKVLDFGLAKSGAVTAGASGAPGDASGLSRSPTISFAATQAGIILGTAAYMSPEQARGRAVDRRTDVWSFGCVLFECLTGRMAFPGETVSDVMAAVLKSEPEWAALPAETPRSVRRLARRCLEKDARRRLRDIGDARLEIEEALAGGDRESEAGAGSATPVPAVARTPRAPLWRRALPWGVAVAAAIVAALVTARAPRHAAPPRAEPTHVSIELPDSLPIDLGGGISLAISPDGRRVAYIEDSTQTWSVVVRALGSDAAPLIAGSESADQIFFSPDGEWIGFFAGSHLQKISVAGGAPIKLCETADGTPGASWGADGTIVFSRAWTGGLWSVSANGGESREITHLDAKRGDVSHRWPQILPDGRHALITIKTADMESFDDATIAIADLRTGETRALIEGGFFARAVGGHVVYARRGALYAAPFDADRLALTGPARPVVNGVVTSPNGGHAYYAVSASGSLVYVSGKPRLGAASLVWVGRSGAETAITTDLRAYFTPRLSPDGRRLLTWVAAANDKLWMLDLDRGTLSRVTSGAGNDGNPVWSPDGRRIAFGSDLTGNGDLYSMAVDGSTPVETLTTSPDVEAPWSSSPDGSTIAYCRVDPKTRGDIWVVSTDGQRTSRPFVATAYFENYPAFSPDGRWIAFASDESGRPEVYVQPFPGPGGKLRVSTRGGSAPRWSRDGREVFYLTDSLVTVPVVTSPEFHAGAPRALFSGKPYSGGGEGNYDVSPDGTRFVMVKRGATVGSSTRLELVIDWAAELDRMLPGGGASGESAGR